MCYGVCACYIACVYVVGVVCVCSVCVRVVCVVCVYVLYDARCHLVC